MNKATRRRIAPPDGFPTGMSRRARRVVAALRTGDLGAFDGLRSREQRRVRAEVVAWIDCDLEELERIIIAEKGPNTELQGARDTLAAARSAFVAGLRGRKGGARQ